MEVSTITPNAAESRYVGTSKTSLQKDEAKAKVYLLDSAAKSERVRLSMQNEALKVLRGGRLLLSPMTKEPEHVLDIATGTANWAFDYLEEHPKTVVTGIDITDALYSEPPSNFHLQIMDMQSEWKFDQPFDLIHAGLIFTLQIDWSRLMRQAFANLRPGGWLEFQEFMLPVHVAEGTDPDSAASRWAESFPKALDGIGHNWAHARRFDRYMTEAGFVDVRVETFRVCYGDWSENPREKAAGILYDNEVNTRNSTLFNSILVKGLGWSPAVAVAIWNERHREALEGTAKIWHDHIVIYGRKPE